MNTISFLFLSFMILLTLIFLYSGKDIKDLKIIKSREEAKTVLKEATPSKLVTVSYGSDCPSPVKVCNMQSFTFPETNGPNGQVSANVNGYKKNGYKHMSNGQRSSPQNGHRISPANGQRISPTNGQRISPPINGQRISPPNNYRLSPPNVSNNSEYNNNVFSPSNDQYLQRISPNNNNRRSPPNVHGNNKKRYSPNNFNQEKTIRHTPTSENGRHSAGYPTKEDQVLRPRLNSSMSLFNN